MPERTLDFLLAAGVLLIAVAAILGNWPERLLIIGEVKIAASLFIAWKQQR